MAALPWIKVGASKSGRFMNKHEIGVSHRMRNPAKFLTQHVRHNQFPRINSILALIFVTYKKT